MMRYLFVNDCRWGGTETPCCSSQTNSDWWNSSESATLWSLGKSTKATLATIHAVRKTHWVARELSSKFQVRAHSIHHHKILCAWVCVYLLQRFARLSNSCPLQWQPWCLHSCCPIGHNLSLLPVAAIRRLLLNGRHLLLTSCSSDSPNYFPSQLQISNRGTTILIYLELYNCNY